MFQPQNFGFSCLKKPSMLYLGALSQDYVTKDWELKKKSHQGTLEKGVPSPASKSSSFRNLLRVLSVGWEGMKNTEAAA